MNKKELQRKLDMAFNQENIGSLLEPSKEGLLVQPLKYIEEWLQQDFDFANRPDLIDVVYAVKKLDAAEICWELMVKVFLEEDLSLQAAMGMLFHRVGEYVPMVFRRGHVLNVYVSAICSANLIEVKRNGKYNYLSSTISMGDRGQRDYGYMLPSVIPHKVTSNKKSSYDKLHVITGGKLKQHDGEVCLDHIQRLSDIPYKVETRILDMIKPVFEELPKYRERKGRFETSLEVEDRRKEFKRFERELPTKINIMVNSGNEFYYGHRYDTRLRTYIKAYHFDYIGNKYCRAFVQPVKGEAVNGAEHYM